MREPAEEREATDILPAIVAHVEGHVDAILMEDERC
jgi:hypothetical protein